MFTWLKYMMGLFVEILSSLHLTEAVIKLILYFRMSLAAGGEEEPTLKV